MITDANPALRARGARGEPGLGRRQGADLAGAPSTPSAAKVEGEARVHARLTDVVPAIFIGFLLNTVLFARLGEVARISVLRRKLHARGIDLPVPTLVGTLVTEQLLSGITLIAVVLGVAAFVSIPGSAAIKLLLVLSAVVLVIAHRGGDRSSCGRATAAGRYPSDQDPVEHWWHLLGISLSALLAGAAPGSGRSSGAPAAGVGAVHLHRCRGWRRWSASSGRSRPTASTEGMGAAGAGVPGLQPGGLVPDRARQPGGVPGRHLHGASGSTTCPPTWPSTSPSACS